MSDIPVEGWHLENRQAGHSKFYTVLIADNGVVSTSWGRIGTNGQSRVQKCLRYDDARDVGLRQLYSKKSKGYESVAEEVKFTVNDALINQACTADSADRLNWAFHEARQKSLFDGDAQATFKHYDSFIHRAQKLLGRDGEDFVSLHDEFEQLKASWSQLDEKHKEAATTIALVEQMLTQALMSGR